MSTASLGDTIRQLTSSKPGRKQDYKQKLEQKAKAAEQARQEAQALDEQPYAEQIRTLAHREHEGGVAFQSVLVAVLQVLDRVVSCEEQVAKAAISLGQQETVHEMLLALQTTKGALCTMLSDQGAKMHRLSVDCPSQSEDELSWWFTVAEAVQTLEGGIDCITSIVSSQPKGGISRTLSSIVARQLRQHHQVLLAEADEWMA